MPTDPFADTPSFKSKPVLIYDGRCGFCKIWINYWRTLTRGRIDYKASQQVAADYPQISPEEFRESVQYVRPDGSYSGGARAVFESLNLLWLYPALAIFAEPIYKFIAHHRNFFYRVTRLTFGTKIEPTRFAQTQWLFIRALGLIYVIAFASLAMQVTGLIGSRGILPVTQFLPAVQAATGGLRFLAVPSIFWFAADDATLFGLAMAGVIFGILLFVTGFLRRRFERLLLVLLFILYLSFSSVGQDFLQFQWDSLLVETGFLAIFLGRNRIVPWLFRWLVFRLMFMSAVVKLVSGDPTWRSLTALDYHFHTQPLPTVFAWYADKLPPAVLHVLTASTLVIEGILPFFIFLPRMQRMFAAWCFIALELVIALTGNYGFFNLLSLALILFLFDDRVLGRIVGHWGLETRGQGSEVRGQPSGQWSVAGGQSGTELSPQGESGSVGPGDDPGDLLPIPEPLPQASKRERIVAATIAVVVVWLGIGYFLRTFRAPVPAIFQEPIRYMAALQIVNPYGLFAVMTTVRPEIIVEGSNDGQNWLPYQFKYKPGDVNRAPRWTAPLQPRLDWQMWFAALGGFRNTPWFANLVVRLLEGSPEVLSLFESDPFRGQPPRYIRANLYEYRFSTWDQRRRTGAWWQREPKGEYLPAVGLRGAPGAPPESPSSPSPGAPGQSGPGQSGPGQSGPGQSGDVRPQ